MHDELDSPTLDAAIRVPVIVETYLEGQLESTRTIYMKSKLNREWLAKHQWWAANNRRTIILIPLGCRHVFDYGELEA